MQKYSTIISCLKMLAQGDSTRSIRSALHIGSSTLQTIKTRFDKMDDLSIHDLEEMSPDKVIKMFYPGTKQRDSSKPLPDFGQVYEQLHKERSKQNLFYCWKEYKEQYPNGYEYTQYCTHFKEWLRKSGLDTDVRMAVERKPGEIVFIDWIGDTLSCLYDPDTGELKKAHFFITTVGVSSYTYVEAFTDEKLDHFLEGVVHALQFYGALPHLLKPDNLKTAVTRHTRDELLLNSAFRDLEHFYDVIVVPPPSRKPRGKASVEEGVSWMETHLLEKLKGRRFYSIFDLNAEIRVILDKLNDEIRQNEKKSRKELFDTYDKPHMRPLPGDIFRTCQYIIQTVPNNYHVKYDNHYYSVPYKLIGQQVILKISGFSVQICDSSNHLICTHKRLYNAFPRYATVKEHMPLKHQYYQEINTHNGDYYRRWAKVFGKPMYDFIDRLLRKYEFEEQAYNSCNGILHMAKDQPKSIVCKAAQECLDLQTITYSYFKRCLNELTKNKGNTQTMPRHQNIRGKENYK